MGWLYHLNAGITHGLEGFLETAVPMIAGLAEVIGLFIIVTSLIKATYHRGATFFQHLHDFNHESRQRPDHGAGIRCRREIAKTFLFCLRIWSRWCRWLPPLAARHDEPDAANGKYRADAPAAKSGKRHRSGKE